MIRKANKRTGKGFEIQFYSDADGSASSVIAVDTVEELAQFLARGCWGQNLGENLPTIWKDGERWCFREYTPVNDDNNIQSTDVYLITVISPEGFYFGRESMHWHGMNPDKVIANAYDYYQCNFDCAKEENTLDDPDEEMLTYEQFSDSMKAGFAGDARSYVLIQCRNDHLQFEASLLEAAAPQRQSV